MGIFVVKPISISSNSGTEPLKTLNMKVKRMVPPSGIFSDTNEQIVTLKSGESKTRNVTLKAPEVAGLERGKKYAVGVSGIWHGVWVKGSKESDVLSVGEDSGVLRGSFEVEGVEAECF